MKRKCHLCPKEYQSPKDREDHLKKYHGLSVAQIKQLSEEEKSEFAGQCAKILDEIKKER